MPDSSSFSSSPSRLWVRVSLGAVRRNLLALKALLPPESNLSAVIKADAYGHGMLQVARAALDAGCRFLIVFSIEEAAELRHNGFPDCGIITVGPGETWQAADAVAMNISVCVGGLDMAEALNAAARAQNTRAKLHVKLDTGMGRFGFLDDPVILKPQLEALKKLDHLDIEGVATHFSKADEPASSSTREQMRRFCRALRLMESLGIEPPWIHAANSGAIVHFPNTAFTLARAGIAMYGVNPGPAVEELNLEPVMSLGCRVAEIREMPADETIGYGRSYITVRPTRLALLPVGYGNGYPRAVSGRGAYALIRGKRAPILGRVTMNTIVANITDIPGVEAGDTAILFGSDEGARLPVEDVAGRAGMIPYEVLCNVGRSTPRVWEE